MRPRHRRGLRHHQLEISPKIASSKVSSSKIVILAVHIAIHVCVVLSLCVVSSQFRRKVERTTHIGDHVSEHHSSKETTSGTEHGSATGSHAASHALRAAHHHGLLLVHHRLLAISAAVTLLGVNGRRWRATVALVAVSLLSIALLPAVVVVKLRGELREETTTVGRLALVALLHWRVVLGRRRRVLLAVAVVRRLLVIRGRRARRRSVLVALGLRRIVGGADVSLDLIGQFGGLHTNCTHCVHCDLGPPGALVFTLRQITIRIAAGASIKLTVEVLVVVAVEPEVSDHSFLQ